MVGAGGIFEQSTLILSGTPINVGGVVSSTVKVADVELVLPQASVAVKVTKPDPAAPQVETKSVKSFDQVIDEQLSDATAPPLEFNQAIKSAELFPSHSTVRPLAVVVIVGSMVSIIVIVCVTLIELSQSSVTLYVLVIISGQVLLSETSETKATIGGIPELSASSVTTFIFGSGKSSIHSIVIGCGLLAVGGTFT